MALVAGLLLTGVAALRWRVGADYWQYADNYHDYVALAWGDLEFFGEPGIRVLAKVSPLISDDSATMFALAAIITVGLTMRTLYRHSTAFALSVLLYVLTASWQGSFNGVRQYLACAVIFAGHRFILERQLWKYLLVVGVASLFHISALVMILLYWVPRSRLGPLRAAALIGLAVGAIYAYDFAGNFIDLIKQDDVSEGSYFSESVHPLRVAAAFAPSVLYVMFTMKERLGPADFFYVNVLFVNAAVMLASSGSAYIARFAIYTGIYAALAIPRLLNMRDPSLRGLLLGGLLVFYAVFWYVDTTQGTSLSDFKWVWER